MRAKWKGPIIKQNFVLKKTKITVVARSVEIVPKFIGLNFNVHNGKNYINLKITEKMLNHKFGEFCFTKFKIYGTKIKF